MPPRPNKFWNAHERECWRGLNLYLRMINPAPAPHGGSLRNLELIYGAQKNGQSEEAVLWLQNAAIPHLGDVSLNQLLKGVFGNTAVFL